MATYTKFVRRFPITDEYQKITANITQSNFAHRQTPWIPYKAGVGHQLQPLVATQSIARNAASWQMVSILWNNYIQLRFLLCCRKPQRLMTRGRKAFAPTAYPNTRQYKQNFKNLDCNTFWFRKKAWVSRLVKHDRAHFASSMTLWNSFTNKNCRSTFFVVSAHTLASD